MTWGGGKPYGHLPRRPTWTEGQDPRGRKDYIHCVVAWLLKAEVWNMRETCVVPHVEGVATHILQKAGHVRLVPELWPR